MTRPKKSKKPSKPQGCPLFPHACGQWAKKINNKLHYFGPWSDLQGAMRRWSNVQIDLLAGRVPTTWDAESITVGDAINLAIAAKDRQWGNGALSEETFSDYVRVGKLVVDYLDRDQPAAALRPAQFAKLRAEFAKEVSPVTLQNRVRRAKVLFNWAIKNGHIEGIHAGSQIWGTEFESPPARQIREAKAVKGQRFIPAARICRLLRHAPPMLRGMILLGINCAYGPTDCTQIERKHITGGWATLPRSKTGKTRRAKLWPETIKAIELVTKDHSEKRLFLRDGEVWKPSQIGNEFAKLKHPIDSFGFYWLRHTFLTVAEETRDFEAARAVMGHIDASVTGQYREGISDQRLAVVSEFVREWLVS